MKNRNYVAVITADMVNSTRFSEEQTNHWLKELIEKLVETNPEKWLLTPEVYRGDSFQAVLKNPEEVLGVAILSRALMKSYAPQADIRIAIGIGTADLITDRPGTSDGEAFRLSGRLADHIRQQKARIAIALPQNSETLSATLDLLETVIEGWTVAQSEVIAALLQQKTVTQIAEMFSISQPAVSQRVAAAKWWAIESCLNAFPKYLA